MEQQLINDMGLFDNINNKLKSLSLDKREDMVTYLETRDLLLNKGFINSYDEDIQKIYWQLFSENKYFDENFQIFKDLQSEKIELRSKASDFLVEEAYNSYSNLRKMWLKDPRTIDIVTNVLKNEKEENIYVHLARFLGMNAVRYGYDDVNVFESIVSRYDKLSDKAKIMVVAQTFHFPTEKKWTFISDVLKINLDKIIALNFSFPLGSYLFEEKELPKSIKDEILSRYLNIVIKAKSGQVANEATKILLNLATKKDVKILEDSLRSKKIGEYSKSLIQNKIYEYKNR